jgi:hypothetical protein
MQRSDRRKPTKQTLSWHYEVANLADTVSKAKATGATVLVDPYTADRRQAAIISFPGNYIAEVHSAASQ